MNTFCKWQTSSPNGRVFCIFRLMENQVFDREEINIFCPYILEEKALEQCPEFRVTKVSDESNKNKNLL